MKRSSHPFTSKGFCSHFPAATAGFCCPQSLLVYDHKVTLLTEGKYSFNIQSLPLLRLFSYHAFPHLYQTNHFRNSLSEYPPFHLRTATMKTSNGVILLPHRLSENLETHAPPLSADWSDNGDLLFSNSRFMPPMTRLGFFLLLAAMIVVALIGIRIALLSGRTTRWQQQTPLSPLALTARGRGMTKKIEESLGRARIDEELGLDEEEEMRMKFG